MKAPAFRLASSEDIYDGHDGTEESVPSHRRITVRIGRPRVVPFDYREATTEPPASPPAYQPADEASVIPDRSVRRMRIAKVQSIRVSGAPESIEELVTEALLRDPRRD